MPGVNAAPMPTDSRPSAATAHRLGIADTLFAASIFGFSSFIVPVTLGALARFVQGLASTDIPTFTFIAAVTLGER